MQPDPAPPHDASATETPQVWPTTTDAHPAVAKLLAHVSLAARDLVTASGRLDESFMTEIGARAGATVTGAPRPAVVAQSDLHRSVLEFAEQLVADPHGVTDDMVHALTVELDPAEVVALTIDVGMADAVARLGALLAANSPSAS